MSRLILGLCCLCAAVTFGGQAAYLQAKGAMAQWLIADAWRSVQVTGQPQKPWQWADFVPLAKLQLNDQRPLYVLSSGSDQSLAFGPSHLSQSTLPGAVGQVVIAAHNDSHFSGLKTLRKGHRISVETTDGRVRTYQVTDKQVIDVERDQLVASDNDELILITCYPFNSLQPNGPLRLVVRALPLPAKLWQHEAHYDKRSHHASTTAQALTSTPRTL